MKTTPKSKPKPRLTKPRLTVKEVHTLAVAAYVQSGEAKELGNLALARAGESMNQTLRVQRENGEHGVRLKQLQGNVTELFETTKTLWKEGSQHTHAISRLRDLVEELKRPGTTTEFSKLQQDVERLAAMVTSQPPGTEQLSDLMEHLRCTDQRTRDNERAIDAIFQSVRQASANHAEKLSELANRVEGAAGIVDHLRPLWE